MLFAQQHGDEPSGKEALTLLLAGLASGRYKDPEGHLERRTRSQLAALEALLEFCRTHASEIRRLVDGERKALAQMAGQQVVLRMDHLSGGDSMTIPVVDLRSGHDSLWQVHPFHDRVVPQVQATLPDAYLIPPEEEEVLQILKRHHVDFRVVGASATRPGKIWTIDTVFSEMVEEEEVPRPLVERKDTMVVLRIGDVLVPTRELHALFLATALELESLWGLVKYPQFSALLRRTMYPIVALYSVR